MPNLPDLPPTTRSLREEIYHLRRELRSQRALTSYYRQERDRLAGTLTLLKEREDDRHREHLKAEAAAPLEFPFPGYAAGPRPHRG